MTCMTAALLLLLWLSVSSIIEATSGNEPFVDSLTMAGREEVKDELRNTLTRAIELLGSPYAMADEDDIPPLPPPIISVPPRNSRTRPIAMGASVGVPSSSSITRPSMLTIGAGEPAASSSSVDSPFSSSSERRIGKKLLCFGLAAPFYYNYFLIVFLGLGNASYTAARALRSVRSQAEQRLNFAPYQRRAGKASSTKPVQFTFFCLLNREADRVPTTKVMKLMLLDAGAGEKSVTMSPSLNAKELRDEIISSYPLLAEGGGFELLRCIQNSRELQVIPYNFTTTPRYLKAYVGGGKVYIRPLQKDLSSAPVATAVADVSDVTVSIIMSISIEFCR